MKNFRLHILAVFILVAGMTISTSAQDKMMSQEAMMADAKKPVVAIIRADWCPYCTELEPKMTLLMQEYGDRLNFIILDITNRETAENAKTKAKAAGLASFFDSNKTKASTVAIFKGKKQIFSTIHNSDGDDLAKAFAKAVGR